MWQLALAVMMIFTSASDRLRAACSTAWQPADVALRSQWCEDYLRFPPELGVAGPFEFSTDHAYFREPLDAVDDLEVREIVVMGAPQIGKTGFVMAAALSQGEVAVAPMMFAGPDQDYITENRQKLYRLAEACPILRPRLPPDRLRNNRAVELGRCRVYLGFSGSTQTLSGRSCRTVLCSEVDRWVVSTELAKKRTRAFKISTVIYEGSPVGASPQLKHLYQGSDRRTYRVPCPHCGEYQALRFFPHRHGDYAGRGGVAGLKDEKGDWRTPEEARKHAWYICERNGCRIEAKHKPWMVRRGVWAPEGCEVDSNGQVTGQPANPGRRRGYQLGAIYAASVTFGELAEEYLRLRDTEDGLMRFFNDSLGLPYEARGKTPRWRDLGQRLAGAVPRGIVPRWAYFLTATADVQARCVYWSVRAWGDGKKSQLVDFGQIEKNLVAAPDEDGENYVDELASDLAQLDAAILLRRWPVDGENPRGLSHLAVRLLGIDRGYRQTDVDEFLRQHPGERVIAVFGDPRLNPTDLYRPKSIERSAKTGKYLDQAHRCWGLATQAYKSEIADRWTADRTKPGAWLLPSDILETPGGEDYLRQITSEKREAKIVNGRRILSWVLISNELPNHYWDTEVYHAALADMITGRVWDAEQWPDFRPQKRRKEEAAAVDAVVARDFHTEEFSAR